MKKHSANKRNLFLIKATNIFIIVLLCLLFPSCKEKSNESKQNILSVPLKPEELTASTLFKDIKIIPLETSDQCLIKTIGRITEYKDQYYILDTQQSILYCFNKQGSFLYKIDKNGNGPDEYHLIYEMITKPEKN
ncbi:6-bladed beta-propeller [Parabacteroides timonensis]|uniref:6-bladed beta-propeller n=1 Tax=Parabacteroides timonensis TaxID=1871013 RepID=UPI0021D323EA|nr:6-bladed beta-propeller [Parabacteroides timonensis]